MKTCLVLEGGAMRGMFTAGALDVFYGAGIHFDGIIGVSAGAAFGVTIFPASRGGSSATTSGSSPTITTWA